MSLPWIMVAMFPSIAKVLPKPGKWMNRLRVVLGFMMLLSCIWLITLLIPILVLALFAAIFVAIALILLLLLLNITAKKRYLLQW